MISIINNVNNLSENDITETVTRVKALIINSKNEILLGHSHCEYQFPGGHIEGNENLLLGLKRELLEETGLEYDTTNLEPIGVAIGFHKDHPEVGKNRKTVIYYYEIKDDRIPDLSNTNYTDEELDGNFTLRYVPLSIVEDVLKRNVEVCGDGGGISDEMLKLFEAYLHKIE